MQYSTWECHQQSGNALLMKGTSWLSCYETVARRYIRSLVQMISFSKTVREHLTSHWFTCVNRHVCISDCKGLSFVNKCHLDWDIVHTYGLFSKADEEFVIYWTKHLIWDAVRQVFDLRSEETSFVRCSILFLSHTWQLVIHKAQPTSHLRCDASFFLLAILDSIKSQLRMSISVDIWFAENEYNSWHLNCVSICSAQKKSIHKVLSKDLSSLQCAFYISELRGSSGMQHSFVYIVCLSGVVPSEELVIHPSEELGIHMATYISLLDAVHP